MTMVASGQIDLGGTATVGSLNQSIQQEFGYGTFLNAYRGKLYTNAAGTTTSPFPNTSNPISMNDFYSTRKIPSGSVTYSNGQSGNFSIPGYNTITITVLGAGGGGGGGGGASENTGWCSGGGGATGNPGGSSIFAQSTAWQISCPGGGGGGGGGGQPRTGDPGPYTGANGTSYNGGNGGSVGGAQSGAGNGGSGGAGQSQSVSFANPVAGGSGPTSGTSLAYVTGVYGSGGGGGGGYKFNGIWLGCGGNGTTGGSGGNGGVGSITISWS